MAPETRIGTPSVKAWNEQVRLLAESPGAPETTYGFYCECGCGEIVGLTAAQYDRANGAWSEGHKDVSLVSRRVRPPSHSSSSRK
jgi:hypothetical protein